MENKWEYDYSGLYQNGYNPAPPTGRGPSGQMPGDGGMPVKLMESDKLKYFIIQIASGHFG